MWTFLKDVDIRCENMNIVYIELHLQVKPFKMS